MAGVDQRTDLDSLRKSHLLPAKRQETLLQAGKPRQAWATWLKDGPRAPLPAQVSV